MTTQMKIAEATIVEEQERAQEWFVFTENRAAVIAALEQGECDGILPAARGFMDGFAEFCLRAGVLDAFAEFRDRRARSSIPMFFFCKILVHRCLFQFSRLQPMERTLFRSSYILHSAPTGVQCAADRRRFLWKGLPRLGVSQSLSLNGDFRQTDLTRFWCMS